MKREDLHEGQSVVYRAHPDAKAEDGRVVRLDDRQPALAYVLYRGDSTAKATYITDLVPLEVGPIQTDRPAP